VSGNVDFPRPRLGGSTGFASADENWQV